MDVDCGGDSARGCLHVVVVAHSGNGIVREELCNNVGARTKADTPTFRLESMAMLKTWMHKKEKTAGRQSKHRTDVDVDADAGADTSGVAFGA